jgi:hypothetical protein
MDIKVYKKEEVLQPQGAEYVYVPDVIDIIPELVEVESTDDVKNHVWNLETLKRVADVKVENGKLIINSDKVRYENGNLYVTLTTEELLTCETLEDDSRELLEQECSLATIWQRGLDPLDLEDGIRWSEAILEELSCLQLIQDIIEAVAKVTTSVQVVFDTVEGENGQQYLSYRLLEVA